MFVDASAIVAVLTEESDGETLAAELDRAAGSVTSVIAVWESAASISRKTGRRAEQELTDILAFLDLAEVEILPVDLTVAAEAITAFDRYGRRSGHRADLNMGDCFAYAFAKTRDVVLLYKGKDFAFTDVQRL
ncbi:MAG TPA: type II toxin-antitoxin system VapC family toxin [Pseudolabrys sp.]|nr:type II toxin-antitoxin system VapC family toxin [Pseudolabrys sp.]